MKYDIIIIGAGPAGYVSAIRAGQLGLKTALVEKKHIGGMCLNWGCIPSKAVIESAKQYKKIKNAEYFGIDGIDKDKLKFNWEKAKNRAFKIVSKLTSGVDFLLKKNNVDVIIGEAKITNQHTVSVNNRALETENIIIATGSFPTPPKFKLPKKVLLNINELFELKKLPKEIAIWGHGPVAVELAQFFNLIDKKVNLIAPQKNLIPKADKFLNEYILKKLSGDKVSLIIKDKIDKYEDGKLFFGNQELKCDVLINAAMRSAILPESSINIETDKDGFIKTNQNLETNYPNIFAIGDVNGKSYLAHVGSAQGMYVVNKIKGVKGEMNFLKYPLNIYSVPEMAQVGLTEQELIENNVDYKINEFPMSANGKALTEGNSEGIVRILSEKKYGEVLGVQIIADNATDLIAEASAFMSVESTVYDVVKTVHAHPTISEVFMEASMDAYDKAIHK